MSTALFSPAVTMSLQASRSFTRIVSSKMRRLVSSISPVRFSSSQKPPSDTQKKADKQLKTSAKSKSPQGIAAEQAAIDKGDTYKAGEQYYSFTPYSFYDLENELVSKRLPQPSSGEKMKVYCSDKLNTDDTEPPRRLLPEEYGYLVEWPGKTKPKTKYKPVQPIMVGTYSPNYDPVKDPFYNSRIPL